MPKKRRRRYKSYLWTHPKTGKTYARVQIKQDDGKYKTFLKPAINAKHAEQLATEVLNEYATRKNRFIEGEEMTFEQLADWYREKYLIPPVYAKDGNQIDGLRGYREQRRLLKNLCIYFSGMLIKDINEDIMHEFKVWREEHTFENKDGVTVIKEGSIKAATLHRDLSLMTTMFKKAVRKRWMTENPFDFGEKLIVHAREQRREVVIDEHQETQILFAARESRSLIYYVILCLLDTGARPNEIYEASKEKTEPVKWRNFFDYDFQKVKLVSFKGKSRKERFAPVSSRLESALKELWNSLEEKNLDDQIFKVKSFKTAWNTIRKKTGIKDFRLRDMRRTASTRWASDGIENDQRGRALGQRQPQTTFNYTELDDATLAKMKRRQDRRIEVVEIDVE